MTRAQEFAGLNRAEMTERILRIPAHRLGEFEEPAGVERRYNVTRWERHIGKEVLVSRKGAMEACEGQWG